MAILALDPLTEPGAWTSQAPDGVSTLVTVSAATSGGLQIAADTGASGHYVERTLPAPVDLGSFTDLQLVSTADSLADTVLSGWELRLGGAGSAAINAAGNDWARLVPGSGGQLGSLVLVSIGDLVSEARSALTTIRLTRVDPSPSTLGLSSIAALREEMLADVDAALVARLGGVTAGGEGPIPAVVAEAGVALPAQPYLQITNFDVRPAPERDQQTRSRTDYTGTGFTERPPRAAFDLLYELAVFADARAVEAGLIEHVMAELAPQSTLIVNGWPLLAEMVPIPAALGATRPDRVTLWVCVHGSQPRSVAARAVVTPYTEVDLETGALASA